MDFLVWDDKLIDFLIYKFKEDFFYEFNGKFFIDIGIVESGEGGKE